MCARKNPSSAGIEPFAGGCISDRRTREFFISILQGRYLDRADPEKGRFRSFIVAQAPNSMRADKSHGTGPVAGLHSLEKKLEGIPGLNALFLRAGYFMENILSQAGVIKSMGIMAGPVTEDLRLPMIATRDIGACAADAPLKLDFTQKSTHELQEPRNVTYVETAKIVGAAIGKEDLTYKMVPAAR
jgi:hypothetical protein